MRLGCCRTASATMLAVPLSSAAVGRFQSPTAITTAAKNGASFHAHVETLELRSSRIRAMTLVSNANSRREVSIAASRAVSKSRSRMGSTFGMFFENTFKRLTGTERTHFYIRFAPSGKVRNLADGSFFDLAQREDELFIGAKLAHRPGEDFPGASGGSGLVDGAVMKVEIDGIERGSLA